MISTSSSSASSTGTGNPSASVAGAALAAFARPGFDSGASASSAAGAVLAAFRAVPFRAGLAGAVGSVTARVRGGTCVGGGVDAGDRLHRRAVDVGDRLNRGELGGRAPAGRLLRGLFGRRLPPPRR